MQNKRGGTNWKATTQQLKISKVGYYDEDPDSHHTSRSPMRNAVSNDKKPLALSHFKFLFYNHLFGLSSVEAIQCWLTKYVRKNINKIEFRVLH